MKDSILPEEKLLRLIRGQKKQNTPKSTGGFLIQKELFLLNKTKIIIMIFAIFSLYPVASFFYPVFGLNRFSLPIVTPEIASEFKTESKQEAMPLEFYLEGVNNRRIFGSLPAQEAAAQPLNAGDTGLIKDIVLIGIVLGENSQAVIEDKKTQKIFYLTKGQSIGNFRLEEVQEGKVILSCNGQKYELYL